MSNPSATLEVNEKISRQQLRQFKRKMEKNKGKDMVIKIDVPHGTVFTEEMTKLLTKCGKP